MQPATRMALVTAAPAGVVGVIVGGLITGAFGYFSHKSDVDTKLIELSLGVLRADATPENKPLREWAINTIQNRADVTFSEGQRAALLKTVLPSAAAATNTGPPTITPSPK